MKGPDACRIPGLDIAKPFSAQFPVLVENEELQPSSRKSKKHFLRPIYYLSLPVGGIYAYVPMGGGRGNSAV